MYVMDVFVVNLYSFEKFVFLIGILENDVVLTLQLLSFAS